MSTRSGNPAKKAAAVERAKAEAQLKKGLEQVDDELGSVKVKLQGRDATRTITILPFMDWQTDWQDHLNSMNFAGWARAVLDADNYEKWIEAAPSQRQGLQAYRDWEANSGEDLGESEASEDS